jgi:hypothetical protein
MTQHRALVGSRSTRALVSFVVTMSMENSLRASVLAGTLILECNSSLQVGLASAPVLGGDTPESRVHDLIANGHDACERSGFPPGEILRGHSPPCATEKRPVWAPARLIRAPSEHVVPIAHALGVCPVGSGLARAGLASIALPSSRMPDCAVSPMRTAHLEWLEPQTLGDPLGPSLATPQLTWHGSICDAAMLRPAFPAMAKLVLVLAIARARPDSSVTLVDPLSVSSDCREQSHAVGE